MNYMKNKNIIIIVAVAVVVIALIAIFSLKSFNQTVSENDEQQTPQTISQSKAEAQALAANQDWVLDLNSLGRADVYDSVLDGNNWTIRVINYQRPEDQKGFLIVYRVDAYSGYVYNKTVREEVSA